MLTQPLERRCIAESDDQADACQQADIPGEQHAESPAVLPPQQVQHEHDRPTPGQQEDRASHVAELDIAQVERKDARDRRERSAGERMDP